MSHDRGLLIATVALALVTLSACGPAAPSANPLGTTVEAEHGESSGDYTGKSTKIAVTVTDVREGTIAELEAAGYELDDAQKSKTPTYVDVRYENRGDGTIDRAMRPSMEDANGDLISPVVIFDYGAEPFSACPDRGTGAFAPGDTFGSCTLFLISPDRPSARVAFLPYVPGKETDFIYWADK